MNIIKKKRVLGLIISLFAVILCITGFSLIKNHTMYQYNKNPDITSKIVGSDCLTLSRIPFSSIDELVAYADLIIVGTVISDGVTIEKEIDVGPSEAEKLISLFGKSNSTYSVTQSQIKIEEVLYGDVDTDVIMFNQMGKAESNNYQTKAIKNDKMILALKKSDTENTYASVAFEDGMFLVNGKDEILSLSRNMAVAKYDGIDKSILKKDFKKSTNKENK